MEQEHTIHKSLGPETTLTTFYIPLLRSHGHKENWELKSLARKPLHMDNHILWEENMDFSEQ